MYTWINFRSSVPYELYDEIGYSCSNLTCPNLTPPHPLHLRSSSSFSPRSILVHQSGRSRVCSENAMRMCTPGASSHTTPSWISKRLLWGTVWREETGDSNTTRSFAKRAEIRSIVVVVIASRVCPCETAINLVSSSSPIQPSVTARTHDRALHACTPARLHACTPARLHGPPWPEISSYSTPHALRLVVYEARRC